MSIETRIMDIVSEELTDFLTDYVNVLQSNLIASGKLNRGTLYNSIQFQVMGMTATVQMEEYGEFVDKGRQAGSKFPPRDSILQWVQDKGLTLDDSSASLETQQDQLTFLISRKISEQGIEPTNFIEDPNITMLEMRINDRVETAVQEHIENL